jgi:hypothetical protein
MLKTHCFWMWFCVTEFVIFNMLKNCSAFIVGLFYCEYEDTKLSETLETARPVTQCPILATFLWEPQIPCCAVVKHCHTKSPVKSELMSDVSEMLYCISVLK